MYSWSRKISSTYKSHLLIWWLMMLSIFFHILICSYYINFGGITKVLLTFNWLFVLLLSCNILYIFWMKVFYQIYNLNIFSLSVRLIFSFPYWCFFKLKHFKIWKNLIYSPLIDSASCYIWEFSAKFKITKVSSYVLL